MVTLKSEHEIERMRASGKVVAEVLQALEAQVRPGMATAELDRLAESIIRAHEGARKPGSKATPFRTQHTGLPDAPRQRRTRGPGRLGGPK